MGENRRKGYFGLEFKRLLLRSNEIIAVKTMIINNICLSCLD